MMLRRIAKCTSKDHYLWTSEHYNLQLRIFHISIHHSQSSESMVKRIFIFRINKGNFYVFFEYTSRKQAKTPNIVEVTPAMQESINAKVYFFSVNTHLDIFKKVCIVILIIYDTLYHPRKVVKSPCTQGNRPTKRSRWVN